MSDPFNINNPENAMTLLHDIHGALGSFNMAFEETMSLIMSAGQLISTKNTL